MSSHDPHAVYEDFFVGLPIDTNALIYPRMVYHHGEMECGEGDWYYSAISIYKMSQTKVRKPIFVRYILKVGTPLGKTKLLVQQIHLRFTNPRFCENPFWAISVSGEIDKHPECHTAEFWTTLEGDLSGVTLTHKRVKNDE